VGGVPCKMNSPLTLLFPPAVVTIC
jgi:hypothetical protein